jgi:ankyrin repeat protein
MKRKTIVFLLAAAGFLALTRTAMAQEGNPADDENPEVIRLLTEYGVDLDYPNDRNYIEPWRELIKIRAPLEAYERLLSLGVKAEPDMFINETPLVTAIQESNEEAVAFLIRNGANVCREHARKRSPLHIAATYATPRIIELLLKAGATADINKADGSGLTPLHAVFQTSNGDHAEKVKVLLKNGANINAAAADGRTPLMYAVSSFLVKADAVEALLSGKPNINALDSKKQSALMIAASNAGNPAIILLLLNAGANAKFEDNTGRTALDYFDQNKRIKNSPVRKELKDRM